ncbi:UvrD-helicase domain-containing protein [Sunxiuqinia dokdonensis]|uniref:UvrD-like helicase ATP-binding domain-containing protein n=1 Tax=Sunxiuqinia dokdonensis TaxID=1409788 RepID=A0A0L8V4R2_9BACT|nr:UvrD-helicase domain-containing protein [Sunxiuqinia dokdonensis]KOH43485.1 hypothetical protein NC99_36980 [Sunxiuqinia dokdonensis]
MNEADLIYKPFISESKSLVIAPAGHGKTHCIVECLNLSKNDQLILTHTNAGVAAIKEKIKKIGVKTSYTVETICGFAQKYVEAFVKKQDIPEQDSEEYFPFIISAAMELFEKQAIRNVIKANHSGIFVDEYQDCTKSQHRIISLLSEILPTHILGDPLQGIFDFNNEDLVDFNTDLDEFKLTGVLSKPWRWVETNNALGDDLLKLRKEINHRKPILLTDFPSFENHFFAENQLYDFREQYNAELRKIIGKEKSLLIIHPVSHNKNARAKLVKTFNNSFYLVEAMDDREFYSLPKQIDGADNTNIYSTIREISLMLFSKSKVNDWLGENRLKSKRDFQAKLLIEPLKKAFDSLSKNIQLKTIAYALKQIKQLPENKCYRGELYSDLLKAIEQANINKKTVFESMKEIRDSKRHIGRKISGKCIGSTLLTKGLEFDTVVILNAQRFECPKNFYVALTRASRRLIIFSDREEISFS